MMEIVVDFSLLALLAATALAILTLRSLFAAAMLTGIYSFLSAGLFTVMDAVDVAFTEAAVGAGVSTILMLGTLALVGKEEKKHPKVSPMLLSVVVITGGVLMYGTLDMPPYGAPDNPVHLHVAPEYIEGSEHDIEVPNVVTSVLASYRGYDTMGETAVVFTALVGVILLLGRSTRREEDHDPGAGSGSGGTAGAAPAGGGGTGART